MVYHVKHQTASGSLTQAWTYDPRTQTVHVTFVDGARTIEFDVAVCGATRPRFSAYLIKRVDGETWRVVPLKYWRTWKTRVEVLEPVACALASSLSPGSSLVLRNTPPHVTAELEAL